MTRALMLSAALLTVLAPPAVLLYQAACATPAAPEEATTAPSGAEATTAALRQRIADLEAENARLSEEGALRLSPFWIVWGFVGQFVFGMRFVVQWIATERKKESVVPVSFWYLSLLGSATLLAYAIYRIDPVLIAGFSLNMVIYVRNLYFIHVHPRKRARQEALGEAADPAHPEKP